MTPLKTSFVVAASIVLFTAVAWAERTSQRLTTETIHDQPFHFQIEVTDRFHEGRELRMQVTVRPKGPKFSEDSRYVAELIMKDDQGLIASSPVVAKDDDGALVYSFLVGSRHLDKSTFIFGETVTNTEEPVGGRYYWFRLADFVD
jgi:hypothetical protein